MDRLVWYDRWGSYLGEIKQSMLLDAIRKIELNGEDSITITTTQPIAKGNRILWRDGQNYWHEFVVSSIEETHDDSGRPISVVWCESSLCELRGDYIVNERPGVSRPVGIATALERALSNSRWTVGTCEPVTTAGASLYHVSAWDALSTVIETWGGEIEPSITVNEQTGVTARALNIRNHRGKTTAQITRRFEWTRDITSIKRTVDETDVITACYAWGKGEEIEDESGDPTGGYGRRIGIADVNPTGLDYIVDDTANAIFGRADGAYVFGEYLDENCTDPQELYSAAVKYLEENSSPHITYEASVSQFYEAGLDVSGVGIGDEVQVVDSGYVPALRVTARVIAMEWSLLDPSTMTVTLGNYAGNIADIMLSTASKVTSLTSKSAAYDAAASGSDSYTRIITDTINSLFAAAGTYVSFNFDRGIILMNNENESQATWIMELSSAGWRIANTKDSSGQWQWTTAATGAGINANSLIVGIIRDALNRNSWNLETGEFNLQGYASTESISDMLTSVSVEYAVGNSSSTAPTSGWSTNSPVWTAGSYIWQRTAVTDYDGNTTYSNVACIQGAKGDDGTGVTILGSYNTLAELQAAHPTGSDGDAYLVAGDLYVWSSNDSAWTNVGRIQGPQGDPGTSVTVSSVEWASGTSGTTPPTSGWQSMIPSVARGRWLWCRVTYSDNTKALTCSYQGLNGTNGTSVAVQSSTKVDGVTTVVLSDGTTLTIADGEDGSTGQRGPSGSNAYVHIAWATSYDGSDGFSTTVSAGKTYMGVYTDENAADSQTASDYSWSLIKGADGVDGTDGTDGRGIRTVTPQYYLSTSSTSQTGGSWSATQPAWESGKYLWTRSHITWSDNTSSDTTAVLAAAINSANESAASAQSAVTALDSSLNQQEIFNRLTANGSSQGIYLNGTNLYINGSYIRSGTVSADVIDTDNLTAKYVGNSATQRAMIGNISTSATAAETGIVIENNAASNTATSIGMASNANGVFMFSKKNSASYYTPNLSLYNDNILLESPNFDGDGSVVSLHMSSAGLIGSYGSGSTYKSFNVPFGDSWGSMWKEKRTISLGRIEADGSGQTTQSFTSTPPGAPIIFAISSNSYVNVAINNISTSSFTISYHNTRSSSAVALTQVTWFAFYES